MSINKEGSIPVRRPDSCGGTPHTLAHPGTSWHLQTPQSFRSLAYLYLCADRENKRKCPECGHEVSLQRNASLKMEERVCWLQMKPPLFPRLTPLQETKGWKRPSNQNKISFCLSMILSSRLALTVWLLPRVASLKRHRESERAQLSPDNEVAPPLRHFQRAGRRQCWQNFSTCCYSSRENVIQAALLRSRSKSLPLWERALTLPSPCQGQKYPGRTLFSLVLEAVLLAYNHSATH